MKRLLLFFGFICMIFSCGCLGNPSTPTGNMVCTGSGLKAGNESTVYLLYSPTCPHCHAMIEYIESKRMGVKLIKTMETSKYAKYLMANCSFKWDGGVPLLFAVLKNGTLIAIEGYPAKSQEKNGYFMGKEYEINMCNKLKGTPIYENGEYRFCKLPNKAILGNKYAVDYVLLTCEEAKCIKID